MSDDLWLGEGFTSYFDGLILRARRPDAARPACLTNLAGVDQRGHAQSGAQVPQPDRHEPAGAVCRRGGVDRSHRLAEHLHLVLHLRSGDRLWARPGAARRDQRQDHGRRLTCGRCGRAFGKPGQKEPGKVATPYTIDGLKETLAKVSGDRAFANEFFTKYVEGREVVDYEHAAGARRPGAAQAGSGQGVCRSGAAAAWRQRAARRRAWCRSSRRSTRPAWRRTISSPAWTAPSSTSTAAYEEALARNKPGAAVAIRYRPAQRRGGEHHRDARRGSAHRDRRRSKRPAARSPTSNGGSGTMAHVAKDASASPSRCGWPSPAVAVAAQAIRSCRGSRSTSSRR